MAVHIVKTLILLILLNPASALADQLMLKLDNDILVAGTDGHYTNGVELGNFFELNGDHWLQSVAAVVPGWSAEDATIGAYRMGQQIYTPEDIERTDEQPDDRPYAGLLYLGSTVFLERHHQGWREIGQLAADVGMVGPASGAEKVQRGVHSITGSKEPMGWDHQLSNKPFANVGYEHHWWRKNQVSVVEVEYGPSAGLMMGSLYTYAASGIGLRVGQGLQRSAGLPSVAPSLTGNQYIQPSREVAWFGFIDLQGRYMARNQLLEAPASTSSVDKTHWVGDVQAGVAVMLQTWQLAVSCVWRTREFQQQNEHDQFGSLTLTTRF